LGGSFLFILTDHWRDAFLLQGEELQLLREISATRIGERGYSLLKGNSLILH
jgi:hypothetical protein